MGPIIGQVRHHALAQVVNVPDGLAGFQVRHPVGVELGLHVAGFVLDHLAGIVARFPLW